MRGDKTVEMPSQTQTNVTFTKAQKIKRKEGEQLTMEQQSGDALRKLFDGNVCLYR